MFTNDRMIHKMIQKVARLKRLKVPLATMAMMILREVNLVIMKSLY